MSRYALSAFSIAVIGALLAMFLTPPLMALLRAVSA